MGIFDWGIELVLLVLLAVTLVHAIRLERALRVLRNDREALGDAIASFGNSARQAEAGMGRLQSASASTAAALSQRVEQGNGLKDDLAYLIERGESLATRLDDLVRAGRPLVQSPPPAALSAPQQQPPAPAPQVRSKAERDLLIALQGAQ